MFGTPGDGRTRLVLGREPVAIGREVHPGGWVLADPEVSRLHVLLTRESGDGAWVLADQGSRNGTFVDGQRVERAVLSDGSVVRVGRCVLVFRDAVDEPGAREDEAPPLLGPSREMQRVRGDVGRAAAMPVPVLLLGEPGTGKARVAELLHARSGRTGPLVAVPCAALSRDGAALHLFGRTDTVASPAGRYAEAQGGTLFLDGLDALPLEVQERLLRVLEGSWTPRLNVRLVCGLQRPPEDAVRTGTLRVDLLARLAGWTLELPPLRARREDVVPIARALLERRGTAPLLSADAAEALSLFDWPGNVRQLEAVLGAARTRAEGGAFLSCEHLPPEVGGPLQARNGADPGTPLLTRGLTLPPMQSGAVRVEGLSPRMQQTLECLLAGASEKEVAAQLNLSSHTVHDYVKKLYRHFHVSSRAELLATVLGRRQGASTGTE